ncbi:hypothetical protein DMENIID0001_046640 [Sergentomyia squamirostris]
MEVPSNKKRRFNPDFCTKSATTMNMIQANNLDDALKLSQELLHKSGDGEIKQNFLKGFFKSSLSDDMDDTVSISDLRPSSLNNLLKHNMEILKNNPLDKLDGDDNNNSGCLKTPPSDDAFGEIENIDDNPTQSSADDDNVSSCFNNKNLIDFQK